MNGTEWENGEMKFTYTVGGCWYSRGPAVATLTAEVGETVCYSTTDVRAQELKTGAAALKIVKIICCG